MPLENLGNTHCHGAVQEHPQSRYAPLQQQLVSIVQDLLRPFQGKTWDDDVAPRLYRRVYRFGQLVDSDSLAFVQAVPVGRLNQNIVCLAEHRRVLKDGLAPSANIAGE